MAAVVCVWVSVVVCSEGRSPVCVAVLVSEGTGVSVDSFSIVTILVPVSVA